MKGGSYSANGGRRGGSTLKLEELETRLCPTSAFTQLASFQSWSVGNRGYWYDRVGSEIFFNSAYFANSGQGNELAKVDAAGNLSTVKDINPGVADSDPVAITHFNGAAYFFAKYGTHGIELWRSDGTEAGTVMVKDINPGSGDGVTSALAAGYATPHIQVFENKLWFFATDGIHGTELWSSDGTEAGTRMVVDGNPYNNDVPPNRDIIPFSPYFTVSGGSLYYVAMGTYVHSSGNLAQDPFALWIANGTSARQVERGNFVRSNLCDVAGTLYFQQYVDHPGNTLDGNYLSTTAGGIPNNYMRLPFYNGDGIARQLTRLGNEVYFIASGPQSSSVGRVLWRTNGTESGTYAIVDPAGETYQIQFNSISLTAVGNAVYFSARDMTNIARGNDLWRSDGTLAGTGIVKDLPSEPSRTDIGRETRLQPYTTIDGELYYLVSHSARRGAIYRTDGSEEGTRLIADTSFFATSGGVPAAFQVFDDKLYFFVQTTEQFGGGLWRYDPTIPNQLPTAPGTGPAYSIRENQTSVLLQGVASTDPDFFDVLTYSWDLNDDGIFGDLTGRVANVHTQLLVSLGMHDGPRVYPIRLRVEDGYGGVVTSDPGSLTITNSPPTLTVVGPSTGVRGQPLTFTLNATDPSAVDQAAGFTFAIDWDSNGTIDETVFGPSGTQVTHVFANQSPPSFRVTATDKDGGVSNAVQRGISILKWHLQPDAANPALTNLVYGGGVGADIVYFLPSLAGRINLLTVQDNGSVVNRFEIASGVTGKVIVYGQGGNDLVAAEFLSMPVSLFGGDGDDILIGGFNSDLLDGGAGNDILLGGDQPVDGSDTVLGGVGDDILIGNSAADLLRGGAGQDLVIAGRLIFLDLPGALINIRSEWLSGRPIAERVANLSGTGTGPRNNGNTFLLPGVTVLDDSPTPPAVIDQVFGEGDEDWLLFDFSDDIAPDAGVGDVLTNLG